MQTVAIDFDGPVHLYSKGWQDGSIYDEPTPGGFSMLKLLMEFYYVYIHTTRSPVAVQRWMQQHAPDISTAVENQQTDMLDALEFDPRRHSWGEQGIVLITPMKLLAVAFIDDRAIRWNSWPQAAGDLFTHTGKHEHD